MNKQSGKIDIIIIVVLVLAIIGALGYVFWNNYNQQEQAIDDTSDSRQQSREATLKTGQTSDAFKAGITWQYPENWKLTAEGVEPRSDDETAQVLYTLTAPSGKVTVIYNIGQNGGIGGFCLPEDTGTIDHIKLIDTTGDSGLVVMERIDKPKVYSPTDPIVYDYKAHLTKDSPDIRDVKPGDSMCDVGLAEVVPLSDDTAVLLLAGEVRILELDEPATVVDNPEVIRLHYSSPEYRQAVEILRTTQINTNN